MAQGLMNPARIHESLVSLSGLGSGVAVSCGIAVLLLVVTNPTSNHEDAGSIPGLALRVKDLTLL